MSQSMYVALPQRYIRKMDLNNIRGIMWSSSLSLSHTPYSHVPILLHSHIAYLASGSIRACNTRILTNRLLRCLGIRNPVLSCLVHLCVPNSLYIQILVDLISEQKTELSIHKVHRVIFVILVVLLFVLFSSLAHGLIVVLTPCVGVAVDSFWKEVRESLSRELHCYSLEGLNASKLQPCGFSCGFWAVFYPSPPCVS